jgi:NADH:ubiquinone oxidoreductase subunit E
VTDENGGLLDYIDKKIYINSMKTITVCMGSSCFSRGNSVNAEIARHFIETHNLGATVEIRGCLCEGECKNGPNIRIDGKLFSRVTPEALTDLLTHEFGL